LWVANQSPKMRFRARKKEEEIQSIIFRLVTFPIQQIQVDINKTTSFS